MWKFLYGENFTNLEHLNRVKKFCHPLWCTPLSLRNLILIKQASLDFETVMNQISRYIFSSRNKRKLYCFIFSSDKTDMEIGFACRHQSNSSPFSPPSSPNVGQ